MAGFWNVPFAAAAIVALNVICTEPPPGIVKVPHEGLVAPTVGLVVAGRVAPPPRVTEPVDAYVKPAGNASEIATLVAGPWPALLEAVIV